MRNDGSESRRACRLRRPLACGRDASDSRTRGNHVRGNLDARDNYARSARVRDNLAAHSNRTRRNPATRDGRTRRPHVQSPHRAPGPRDLFRDEQGFTTTSMVLSLLITLALLFSAAHVYRVNSAAAEVQDVADAAALAAQTQVGEFMIVATFCDAVVLTLSLTGYTACALGIAALCTPLTVEVAEALLNAGKHLLEARDAFSDRARSALDKLQEALPFFAAACAVSVCEANDADSDGANYLGVALLVPTKGEPTQAEADEKADELTEDIDEKSDEISEKAREAEEAAQQANEAKLRAFVRDCGDNPAYCLYERAAHLAGLSGASNPLYSSVDTWSFSVALDRAREYYRERLMTDEPESGSVDDMVRWELRLRFYAFAHDEIAYEGYVHDDGESFDANFPHLPKNTAEMRATSLYTDVVYPVTEEPDEAAPAPAPETPSDEGGSEGEVAPAEPAVKRVMHVWSGCPGATGPQVGYGSIEMMEAEGMQTCPECGFTAASLGKVAAASSSIDNGFEYHYEAIAREAEEYEQARERAEGPKEEVRDEVQELFDELAQALEDSAGKRIRVSPPGRYGTLALVVNAGSTSAAGGLASGFVSAGGALGPRAAISAATLVKEGSDEGRTVLNSMLDSLREGSVLVGAAGIVVDVWSNALSAYANGHDALVGGLESGLNSLPLASASGLGTWAGDKARDVVKAIGLEPVQLDALKPVLVNSAHVAVKDDGSAGHALLAVKQHVVAHPLYSTDLFSAILTDAEREAIDQVEGLGDSVEIASIELVEGSGVTVPITIPVPPEAKQYGLGLLHDLFDRLRAQHVETLELKPWE